MNVASHPNYQRRGPHLYVDVHLTILECLIGFQRAFQTPDNRTVILSRKRMTTPGTEFEFLKYGLPKFVSIEERRKREKEKERRRRASKKGKEGKESPKLLKNREAENGERSGERSGRGRGGGGEEGEEGEGEEGEERGSLVVVVRLRKESLFEMNEEQRKKLRKALRVKTSEKFEKERRRSEGKKKRSATTPEEEGSGSGEKEGDREREAEEEEDDEEDIYVVHLKENGNQLLTGMGMFWMPKNGSKMKRNMSGGM